MRAGDRLQNIRAALALAFGLNLAFWACSHSLYAKWDGVPPVPSRASAVLMTLGDAQLSYRFFALMLQNLGDIGRDVTPLSKYDYTALGGWFFLLHDLDPVADHVPALAAYYFGASRVPKNVRTVVSYLEAAGDVPVKGKWRWLAAAAVLAQHNLRDLDLALKLAYRVARLAEQEGGDVPQWARQMPALVLSEKGERQAARQMLESIIVTEKDLRPQEIQVMKDFLVMRLGVSPQEVDAVIKMRAAP